MATRQHWEIDIADQAEVWRRVIGRDEENAEQTARDALAIFDGIPDGSECLEIGAGPGRMLKPASQHFLSAVGVDSSASLVEMSKSYLRDWPRCTVFHTDGVSFPFEDCSFDFVFSIVCFQHMTNYPEIYSNIHEAFRVLKPGGLCRIQTVQSEPERTYDGHVFDSPEAFWVGFHAVGFEKVNVVVDSVPYIWVTARKP